MRLPGIGEKHKKLTATEKCTNGQSYMMRPLSCKSRTLEYATAVPLSSGRYLQHYDQDDERSASVQLEEHAIQLGMDAFANIVRETRWQVHINPRRAFDKRIHCR